MIQHINVSKVFNAASNGDVGGAAININSKELFGDAAFGVEAEGGLNSSVPGSNFIRQDGVNYWGASRSTLPTEGSFDFPNSLDPRRVGVPMDHSYAVSGGKLFRLGEQANLLSVFAIASYNQDYAYTRESVRNSTSDGTVYQDQTGDKYDINTNQVVLANVDLKLDRKHELTYNFLLLHANNQYVGDYAGMHSERFQAADDYRGFSRRQQANDNLLMTHQLLTQWTLNDNWRLNAGASYNNIKGLEPDRRENYLTHRTGDEYNLTGSNRQKRFFSTLREHDVNLRVNARYRLVHDMDIDRSNLAFGYVGRLVDDRFEAREYNFSAYPGVYALDGLKLDDLYNAANYEAGRFTMTEGDLNTYHVSKNIHSGYAEATQQFGERFTANLGLRLDYVDMVVDYDVQHVAPGAESINRLYWLPSLNLRYDASDKHTLRLGASKSYTLPQSKEIAPYQYVNISFTSQGNPNLKPSDNYNLDLKWDYYMSASELLSVTAFYKHIANPIGRVDQGNSAGLLTYENIAPRATVAGLEVELRKNLFNRTNAAGTRNNRLSLGVNASYIYTNVTLDIVNTDPRRSQLEGASPFLANADLSYTPHGGRTQLHRLAGGRLVQRPHLHPRHAQLPRHHGRRPRHARLRGLAGAGQPLVLETQGRQPAQPLAPPHPPHRRHGRTAGAQRIQERDGLQPRGELQPVKPPRASGTRPENWQARVWKTGRREFGKLTGVSLGNSQVRVWETHRCEIGKLTGASLGN